MVICIFWLNVRNYFGKILLVFAHIFETFPSYFNSEMSKTNLSFFYSIRFHVNCSDICYGQQTDCVDGSPIVPPRLFPNKDKCSTSTKDLTSQKMLPHSIRLIQLPWCNESKTTTIQLSIDDIPMAQSTVVNLTQASDVRIKQ